MAGSGYAYAVVSENLHILLNKDEPVNNELLHNGMSFVVEDGAENASSLEEV